MVLRNLQPKEGVHNGSRGIVTRISTRARGAAVFGENRVGTQDQADLCRP
jgi:hypothetical protein